MFSQENSLAYEAIVLQQYHFFFILEAKSYISPYFTCFYTPNISPLLPQNGWMHLNNWGKVKRSPSEKEKNMFLKIISKNVK